MRREYDSPAKVVAYLIQRGLHNYALLFDVDGTLAEKVASPADARVPQDVIDNLNFIRSALGAVGIITGRPDEFITETIFGGEAYAGSYSHNSTLRAEFGAAAKRVLPELDMECLKKLIQSHIEDRPLLQPLDQELRKRDAISIHWRTQPEELHDEIETQALAFGKIIADAYNKGRSPEDHIKPKLGSKVLELSHIGASKAAGVDMIMENEPFKGRAPVMSGDAGPDVDGMKAAENHTVNGIRGFGIAVGDEIQDGAMFYLKDVAAMHEVVRLLKEECVRVYKHALGNNPRP
jgi:trehalose-phosphatase